MQRPKTAISMSQKEMESGKYSFNDSNIITKLLVKNNNYFNHLMDQCVCGMCICGKCKCGTGSLKEQNGMPIPTIYQQDYVEKKSKKDPALGNIPQYKDQYKMKFETTQRTDFKQTKARPQTAMKPQNPQFIQPFHAGSTYNLTHIKMPDVEKVNIIPQNFPTVMKDLEFTGSSEYRKNFKGKQQEKDNPVIFGAHSSFGNPINPNLPFFSTTTSQRAFKPYKAKRLRPRENSEHSTSVPTFFGQFTTTTKQDFAEKSQIICPARRLLNERK